uniref:NitT/TauT family transport system permease protein n=1 Tax=Candidatus Kentrum eta TaxID=2126337 RepID=A0A450UU73_9GAMM|nr:MAG: NitT/TauT family transport system permease protein [Candidatus Kentron sp. H]VFJ96109.1 MAG: NitT/TauT family transport system permease protein [Candidatus Kentron sp. H]VFK02170.1 MAG: NitT/TauT family transport system permease protein [Candidatus Kentron sp. H]
MIRHAISVPVLLIFFWWGIASAGIVNPLFLPSPVEVFKTLGTIVVGNQMTMDILFTLGRTIIGFLISAVLGITFGLIVGIDRRVYSYFEFIIDFLRSIPATALFPLFILFFGVGDVAKITAVVFSCSLIVLINTGYGVMNSRKTRLLMVQMYGASRYQRFTKVVLPEALPQIFVGLRTAISIALILVVVTEMFIGTTVGLGYRIYNAQMIYRTSEMYAAILLTGILGYALNQLFAFVEKRLIHWGER